jgi:hypothetical protein
MFRIKLTSHIFILSPFRLTSSITCIYKSRSERMDFDQILQSGGGIYVNTLHFLCRGTNTEFSWGVGAARGRVSIGRFPVKIHWVGKVFRIVAFLSRRISLLKTVRSVCTR